MTNEEDRRRAGARRLASWGLGLLALASVVLAFALPAPRPRQFPERIPVVYWHSWTSQWQAVTEDIVARFNASQDVYEVIPLSIPGSTANTKFLSSVAGGVPPDCLTTWESVIPKWAESGLLMPLNEFMTSAEWEEFEGEAYPAVLKVGAFEGRLYGVTTGLDVYACYARADHLREAGFDPSRPPQTLEELYEWGRKLDRYEPGGRLIRAGFLNPTWPPILATYGPAFGVGLYDWEKGALRINTPDNLRALTTVFGQRERMGVTNVIRFEGGLSAESTTGSWPFLAGAYSITVDGQWRVEQIAKYAPDLEYITFPIPPPRGGNAQAGWAHGNYMVIPRGARQARGAWEFIKFWSGIDEPERAAELYTMGGWLPMSPKIANAPVYREYLRQHPQFQTFLDVLPSEHLVPAPPVPYQQYLWDRAVVAGESVMSGSLTPQAALERLEGEIENELAARRLMGYER